MAANPGVNDAAALTTKLNASHLEPKFVSIIDTSDGCGSKFEAIIVSAAFEGMQLLERQRAVNDLFAEEMKTVRAFRSLPP